jgi:putative ABC transport system permease protein
MGLVMKGGSALIICGVFVGLGGSFAATRLLSGFLFRVTPTDPATFVVVSLSLTLVALLASYIPARRATRVDPLVALRAE